MQGGENANAYNEHTQSNLSSQKAIVEAVTASLFNTIERQMESVCTQMPAVVQASKRPRGE